ncbi:nucleoside triphosphate pyrophosphohydrolase [Gracilibacillus sp. YIM 98692]|uniref:nucleoside triphosphate pyrophosphohydrolase n=1 Tax=Gracilibacillus sp. YIM 98692 TaxID=2663532 RepID=UPI0013D486F2|nr:nucleoside triphosphate pyrophosphohydrolase [Gracilibacillus sp. YIM 98692]
MQPVIHVIGLGGGDINQLPLGLYRHLTSMKNDCYVRTIDHPVIATLREEGVLFQSFDAIYEKHDQFEEVYEEIKAQLIDLAKQKQEITYAVPGHPMVAEQTVKLLVDQSDVKINVQGGHSYLDALFASLKIDPIDGFQFIDATSFNRDELQYRHHIVFCQVYNAIMASEVKLTLMEDLPPEYTVYIVEAAGSDQEQIKAVSLVELDQQMSLSNLTSIYVPPAKKEHLNHQFFRLRETIRILRGPNGCPWDKKQTHESLKKYLLEESYEVLEAIDEQDDDAIAEELGDVLLQVMLHSQIGEDAGFFTIDDVIYNITEKMIRRHPHVFAGEQINDEEELHRKWQAIKNEEKKTDPKSILDGIVKGMSASLIAEEMQKKASKVGFDWDNPKDMWEKVEEEIQEWKEAIAENVEAEMEKELGDILFAIINVARYYNINPETALMRTNQKFKHRFSYVEKQVQQSGKSWGEFSLAELDRFWNEAKQQKIYD